MDIITYRLKLMGGSKLPDDVDVNRPFKVATARLEKNRLIG